MNPRHVSLHHSSIVAAALLCLDAKATQDESTEHPPKTTMRCVAKVDPSTIEQVRTAIRAVSNSGQPVEFEILPDGSLMVPDSHQGPVVFALRDSDNDARWQVPPFSPPPGLINNYPVDTVTPAWASSILELRSIDIPPSPHYPQYPKRQRSKRGARAAAKRRFWDK